MRCKRCEKFNHECDSGRPSRRARRSQLAESSFNHTTASSSLQQNELLLAYHSSGSSSQESPSMDLEYAVVSSSSSSDRSSSLPSQDTQDLQDLQIGYDVWEFQDQSPMYLWGHSQSMHECDAADASASIHAFDVADVPIMSSSVDKVIESDRLSVWSRGSVSNATPSTSSDGTRYSPRPHLLAMQPSRLFTANILERQLDKRLDRLWGNYKTFANATCSFAGYRVTSLFGRTFSELFSMSKQLAENARICL
jgi:hypothetical protein